MPHARIDLVGGVVRIAGESVFRGYFPGTREGDSWTTGDMGSFTPEGSLVILGRGDGVIVTGGKKVFPDEVEEALRSSGEFDDVAVIGVPDPEWGQAVVACHPSAAQPIGFERVKASLSRLASFKHPKQYVPISPWPRNAQGKIDRAELVRIASSR
jgi:O-succinylbenzoic acid--CoA ligase